MLSEHRRIHVVRAITQAIRYCTGGNDFLDKVRKGTVSSWIMHAVLSYVKFA